MACLQTFRNFLMMMGHTRGSSLIVTVLESSQDDMQEMPLGVLIGPQILKNPQ
jgi:hypothetical protein